MARLGYVPPIKWQVVSISGVNYLVPAGGEGVAVDTGRGTYTLIKAAGGVEVQAGNISLSSEATVDGQDVSTDLAPKDYYAARPIDDIATNGTTDVDIEWDEVLGYRPNYLTYEPSEDPGVYEFQKSGVHSISSTLTVDVVTNNIKVSVILYYRPDGTSAWTEVVRRTMHTSTANRTSVSLVDYPITASDGDQIKICGVLSATAAATSFLATGSNLMIKALELEA